VVALFAGIAICARSHPSEEPQRRARKPEPLIEPVRLAAMLRAGDLDAGAMTLARESRRTLDQRLADAMVALLP
jgi:hypothetical protein